MHDLLIRPANVTDYPALAKIYLDSRKQDFPWVENPQLSDFERDSRHEYILVATIDNVPVGFLSFYRLANFIHLLFVDPKHYHQHIGSQLITAMRRQATAPMELKVVLANEAARAFYKQLGFIERKRDVAATPPNITLIDTNTSDYFFSHH